MTRIDPDRPRTPNPSPGLAARVDNGRFELDHYPLHSVALEPDDLFLIGKFVIAEAHALQRERQQGIVLGQEPLALVILIPLRSGLARAAGARP